MTVSALARCLVRGRSMEEIAREVSGFLARVHGVQRTRTVFRTAPGVWSEWKGDADVLDHAEHLVLPDCESGARIFLDPEDEEAGFIWIASTDPAASSDVYAFVDHVYSALLLHNALDRLRRLSAKEAGLSREILRAREDERRRIARELHDDFGQTLATVKLNLKWVEDCLRPRSGLEEAINELKDAREAVADILAKIRDLSYAIYPAVMDWIGLPAAIEELAYRASKRSGVKVTCVQQGNTCELDPSVAIGLYRVCQEGLNNAMKHAQASRINVRLTYNPNEVCISIEDDGAGFDPNALRSAGEKIMTTGFWTIRQRASDMGGSFRIRTSLGNGTVLEVAVPIGRLHTA